MLYLQASTEPGDPIAEQLAQLATILGPDITAFPGSVNLASSSSSLSSPTVGRSRSTSQSTVTKTTATTTTTMANNSEAIPSPPKSANPFAASAVTVAASDAIAYKKVMGEARITPAPTNTIPASNPIDSVCPDSPLASEEARLPAETAAGLAVEPTETPDTHSHQPGGQHEKETEGNSHTNMAGSAASQPPRQTRGTCTCAPQQNLPNKRHVSSLAPPPPPPPPPPTNVKHGTTASDPSIASVVWDAGGGNDAGARETKYSPARVSPEDAAGVTNQPAAGTTVDVLGSDGKNGPGRSAFSARGVGRAGGGSVVEDPCVMHGRASELEPRYRIDELPPLEGSGCGCGGGDGDGDGGDGRRAREIRRVAVVIGLPDIFRAEKEEATGKEEARMKNTTVDVGTLSDGIAQCGVDEKPQSRIATAMSTGGGRSERQNSTIDSNGGCSDKYGISKEGITVVPEFQLDVASGRLDLRVPGLYRLSVGMPFPIDADGARAKFSKKRATLTIFCQEK